MDDVNGGIAALDLLVAHVGVRTALTTVGSVWAGHAVAVGSAGSGTGAPVSGT
jgi:hypothetical protein